MPEIAVHPLTHRVREATARPPSGTLVLLHGRGTDEHDLFGLLDVLDPERRLTGVTVGAPLRLPGAPGKHWYVVPRVGFPEPRTFAASYEALQSLLDDELGLDWSTTVIGGFSQGTVMSYALGLGPDRPRPAGILAQSGFIPTLDAWTPELGSRSGLPVFISHGSLDPIIGIEFAHAARDTLTGAGLDVTYRESPTAHTIDPRVLPDTQAWLRQAISD